MNPLALLRPLLLPIALTAGLLLSPLCQAADEANLQAAYALLDALDMKSNLDASTERLLEVQLQQNPALRPYQGVMMRFFQKTLSYASLRDDLATLYANEFSAEELNELSAFYKTPTGRKALSKMPQLLARGAQLGQSRVQAHLPELKAMVDAEAKRLQTQPAK